MEWIIALTGVLVGAGCTYILTVVRDKRAEVAINLMPNGDIWVEGDVDIQWMGRADCQ